VRLELGGAPSGGEKENADAKPKEPASKDRSTSSDPELSKQEESKPKDEMTTPPPSQEKKPEPKRESPPPKQSESKKTDSKLSNSASTFGSREERRVSQMLSFTFGTLMIYSGQDESHAPPDCRETKAVTKHCGFSYNLQ
jgi:hypothetical protein